MTKIFFGADHAGVALKDTLVAMCKNAGHDVSDLGTQTSASVDYPDFADQVALAVTKEAGAIGVLVCGSGVGMSIAANRHRGVRAVVTSDLYSAKMARLHNDANVLCLGARVVGPGLAEALLTEFLSARFEGGRHAKRVAKLG